MKKHLDAGTSRANAERAPESWQTAETIETTPVPYSESANEAPNRETEALIQNPEEIDNTLISNTNTQVEQNKFSGLTGQNRREQQKIKREIAGIQGREARTLKENHIDRFAREQQHRAVDMRRNEVTVQNRLAELPWHAFGQKRELKARLNVITERLNGLTQSTPEMRRLQRRAEFKNTVSKELPSYPENRSTATSRKSASQADKPSFWKKLFGAKQDRSSKKQPKFDQETTHRMARGNRDNKFS